MIGFLFGSFFGSGARRTAPGCRGSAPTATPLHTDHFSEEWDRIVAECEQRLHLVPADPLFSEQAHTHLQSDRAKPASGVAR